MHRLNYVVCDVFTDRPLAGNQVAVFTDARGLDEHQMQALAREMNFSESTFVLPATADGHAKIRIFTPTHELAFAGHPTLGTAFVVGQPMQLPRIRLETGRGTINVDLEREGARVTFGRMEQPIPVVEAYKESVGLLAALGVPSSCLPIETYDNGVAHVYVALEREELVAAVRPNFSKLACLSGSHGFNVFAGNGERWKTRMFAPSLGVNEDPATGSAAGPLALHLARHGRIPFGQLIRIEQGAEVNRPSVLYAKVEGSRDHVTLVEVGGSAVVVARGTFHIASMA